MKKVAKFGGSSLANARQFKKVKNIIMSDKSRCYIVPSAPGKRDANDTKITDLLYECCETAYEGKSYKRIFDQIKKRYENIISGLDLNLNLDYEFDRIEAAVSDRSMHDYVVSRGEYLNGLILSAYLDFPFVDASDVIFFDEEGNSLSEETNDALAAQLLPLKHAVIPGFYGSKPDGKIATFSRGGSDITGSLVARAVQADLYENWTDVSGFNVADPHIVDNPVTIETITYMELRELAYMGANVLHEDSIFPVRKAGIPINIRNTNHPEDPGTMIVESTTRKSAYTITGVAGKKGFCSINIDKAMMNGEIGFGRKVLQVLEDNRISFDFMPSGIDTLSVIIHQSDFQEKEQAVVSGISRAVHPDTIELESDLAIIAVVGRGMRTMRGTAGRIFSALAHAKINVRMIDQGSSELNIIIGVKNEDFEDAIRAIYDIFVKTVQD